MGDEVECQYDGSNTCEHGELFFNCPICDGGSVANRLEAMLQFEKEGRLP